jgi:hypothetical protein
MNSTLIPELTIVPNVVDSAVILSPPLTIVEGTGKSSKLNVNLNADSEFYMEIETYDVYGNVANTDETYLNVDMFVPGCDTSDGTYDDCESSTYLVEKN